MDDFNPGTLIGIIIMLGGIILAIGKYQYEHDSEIKKVKKNSK